MRIKRIVNRLKANFRGWVVAHGEGTRFSTEREMLHQLSLTTDYLMSILHAQRAPRTPLEACAKKIFSQSDEDGITLEIVKRIGLSESCCIEIGCGNGLENNTLVLLATGWHAIWIDGANLAFDKNVNPAKLVYSQEFITRENVYGILSNLHKAIGKKVELISVDIDGNDGYIVETLLLGGFHPSVFIVEINEVFSPPIVFKQDYRADHVWDRSRNFGWSLQAFADLFSQHGYQLVVCNPQTGVNAFFVRNDHMKAFPDIPNSLEEIYVGRTIHPFKHRDRGLRFDAQTIEHLISGL